MLANLYLDEGGECYLECEKVRFVHASKTLYCLSSYNCIGPEVTRIRHSQHGKPLKFVLKDSSVSAFYNQLFYSSTVISLFDKSLIRSLDVNVLELNLDHPADEVMAFLTLMRWVTTGPLQGLADSRLWEVSKKFPKASDLFKIILVAMGSCENCLVDDRHAPICAPLMRKSDLLWAYNFKGKITGIQPNFDTQFGYDLGYSTLFTNTPVKGKEAHYLPRRGLHEDDFFIRDQRSGPRDDFTGFIECIHKSVFKGIL